MKRGTLFKKFFLAGLLSNLILTRTLSAGGPKDEPLCLHNPLTQVELGIDKIVKDRITRGLIVLKVADPSLVDTLKKINGSLTPKQALAIERAYLEPLMKNKLKLLRDAGFDSPQTRAIIKGYVAREIPKEWEGKIVLDELPTKLDLDNDEPDLKRLSPKALKKLEKVREKRGKRWIDATLDSSKARAELSITAPDGTVYRLDAQAWRHITNGDLVQTVVERKKKRRAITVIGGGLHTMTGLRKFLSKRKDIYEIKNKVTTGENGKFDVERPLTNDRNWFTSYELSNGVIRVKLPESAYSGAALKSLRMAETHNGGGYAWKTLFPEFMTGNQISLAIEEAIKSPTAIRKTSFGKELVGDVTVPHKDQDIKFRIRIYTDKNNKVISAFPAWEQPEAHAGGGKFDIHSHVSHWGNQPEGWGLDNDLFGPALRKASASLDPKAVKDAFKIAVRERNFNLVSFLMHQAENDYPIGRKSALGEFLIQVFRQPESLKGTPPRDVQVLTMLYLKNELAYMSGIRSNEPQEIVFIKTSSAVSSDVAGLARDYFVAKGDAKSSQLFANLLFNLKRARKEALLRLGEKN